MLSSFIQATFIGKDCGFSWHNMTSFADNHSAFDTRLCKRIVCWKANQIMQILKVFNGSKELIGTNLLHQCSLNKECNAEQFSDFVDNEEVLTALCLGKALQVKQAAICKLRDVIYGSYFSSNFQREESCNQWVFVTSGHDNLGSPVTSNRGVNNTERMQCFMDILEHNNTKRYYVSQHRSKFHHKKLSFIPIGLGTPPKFKLGLTKKQWVEVLSEISSEMTIACSRASSPDFQWLCPLRLFSYNFDVRASKMINRVSQAKGILQLTNSMQLLSVKNEYGCFSGREVVARNAYSVFVFSPRGTHYDCYRHWEALLSGSIPIKDYHHTLIDLFSGLPAVTISSNWRDLRWDSLRENLSSILETSNPKYEKLTMDYWVQRVTE
jgi:hypothetical protein